MKHHGWSLTELENMISFERELYIMLLRQWLEEENRKQKEQELKRKSLGYG
jgi:hypothetical protein